MLQETKSILLKAGRLAMDLKKDGREQEADLALDNLFKEKLRALLPSAAWLSEETADDLIRLEAKQVWIVDPLDGTKEYLKGGKEYSLSVALVGRDGSFDLAAVYAPELGLGAISLKGELHAWGHQEFHRSHPSQSLPQVSVSKNEFKKSSFARFEKDFQIIPVSSVALKLLRVALGIDKGYLSFEPKSEWDICGGAGLLEAAQASLERLDGKALAFNQKNTRIEGGLVAGARELTMMLRKMV